MPQEPSRLQTYPHRYCARARFTIPILHKSYRYLHRNEASFCFVSGYPTLDRAKNGVFSTVGPNGPITNDKTTRLQQCCRSPQSRNSATTPLHSSIARPQWLSMGVCGPLRPIHNVMHFSELAEYSQKCTLGSAPPIRSGQHALVLPISGHRRGTKSPRRTKCAAGASDMSEDDCGANGQGPAEPS